MAFFKFRNRGPQANEGRNAAAAAVPAESVEAMRRRARHRLVGAAVLVLVGVIGFPLLFDTQPRPVPVNIPIEVPDRNQAKPLALPATPPPAGGAASPNSNPTASAPSAAPAASASGGMITERADGSEVPVGKQASTPPAESRPAPDAKPEAAPEPKAVVKAEPKTESRPEPKPEPKPEAKSAATADAARARALLDGKSAAVAKSAAATAAATAATSKPATAPAEESGRFIIQVGAFADADKAREVRQKLDKAGLKSYTQVTKTADGERTRVRVGPFSTRAEADRAAARLKGLSLSGSVLSL